MIKRTQIRGAWKEGTSEGEQLANVWRPPGAERGPAGSWRGREEEGQKGREDQTVEGLAWKLISGGSTYCAAKED